MRQGRTFRHWETDLRVKPMPGQLPMHVSQRCGAHCRTTGQPCRQAAMANGRCKMHGGLSTGPKNPAVKHNRYSREARELGRAMRRLAKDLDAKTALAMHTAGLRPLKPLRRKAHVKRALAAAAKAKEAKTE
jgi:hypothetical protein